MYYLLKAKGANSPKLHDFFNITKVKTTEKQRTNNKEKRDIIFQSFLTT
jgi:hypothetical protein